MSLNAISKLSDLLEHPEQVSALPPEAVPVMLGELERLRAILWIRLMFPQSGRRKQHTTVEPSEVPVIDSKELARRWSVPESWIRDSVRSRSADPIPCIRMGRYVRFGWGSAELEAWFERRKEGKKNRLDRKIVSVYQ